MSRPARHFYASVFEVLGIPVGGGAEDHFWADELFVSSPASEAAHGVLTGRHHIAFQARDRATIDAFRAAGLAHGSRDTGGPRERPHHPGYHAAFLPDPDGNTIEAVFHGDADRSAASVKIAF